jgi:hypothetical protein
VSRRAPRCVHCSLAGHTGDNCNRPEGVAARGRLLRMSEHTLAYASANPAAGRRGRRASARRRSRQALDARLVRDGKAALE